MVLSGGVVTCHWLFFVSEVGALLFLGCHLCLRVVINLLVIKLFVLVFGWARGCLVVVWVATG